MLMELPAELDKKTRSKLENYLKKIKKADIQMENGTDRGLPTLKISFESYDKRSKGFMEVVNYYAR